MRLPKDTALNQINWLRNSTSPSWTRFAACLSMQTWLTSSGLILQIMQCWSIIYNNLPHSALDSNKSPNDAYGDSYDFSKLHVFGTISYALQPSKILHKLEERSAKWLFLGIDPAGVKALDLQNKVACIAKTVTSLDGKFLSTEENQIQGVCREEEASYSSSLDLSPRNSLKGPGKENLLQTSLMQECFNFKN